MVTSLLFDGKKFISSGEASKGANFAPDYIGQLCRGGKLVCRRVGKAWFVEEESLLSYKALDLNHAPSKAHRLNGNVRVEEVMVAPVELEPLIPPFLKEVSPSAATEDFASDSFSPPQLGGEKRTLGASQDLERSGFAESERYTASVRSAEGEVVVPVSMEAAAPVAEMITPPRPDQSVGTPLLIQGGDQELPTPPTPPKVSLKKIRSNLAEAATLESRISLSSFSSPLIQKGSALLISTALA